jgi:hypothetical protein
MPTEIDYLTYEDAPADPITGAVDGVYSHNTEHVAEAQSHLIEFFKHGPRNQAVLEAVMAQVQELEGALWAMNNAFDVDTATGDQLDLLGKLVGEARQDRLDAEYRTAVRARVLVNSSSGTMAELLAIGAAISPTAVIAARELYPAAMSLEFDTFGDSSLQETYRLLRAAKTAGVRLDLAGPTSGGALWGAVDGSPAGFVWGAVDGSPAGGTWVGGT